VLTIVGRHLVGDSPMLTFVSFDGGDPAIPDSVQPALIRITIPNTLQAGVRTVRVLSQVQFDVPSDPHSGLSSGPAQFLLAPVITTLPPISAAVGSTLSLGIKPGVGRSQRAKLLLGDHAIELDARPPSDPPTSNTLQFKIPADFPTSAPNPVPLRVEVDGVQSKLTLDPGTNRFLPEAVITP
jgi:hypothetical protein